MPSFTASSSNPASGAYPVTPHNTNKLEVGCRALYIGTGGDLAGLMRDGSTATFKNLPSGTILPISFDRVNATNTTAADILALY